MEAGGLAPYNLIQPTISLEMPDYQVRVIAVFLVFWLLTDFICLLIYEFCLSLWKIARCSVILLLPLFVFLYFAPMHLLFYISFVLGTVVPLFVFLFFKLVSRSSFI